MIASKAVPFGVELTSSLYVGSQSDGKKLEKDVTRMQPEKQTNVLRRKNDRSILRRSCAPWPCSALRLNLETGVRCLMKGIEAPPRMANARPCRPTKRVGTSVSSAPREGLNDATDERDHGGLVAEGVEQGLHQEGEDRAACRKGRRSESEYRTSSSKEDSPTPVPTRARKVRLVSDGGGWELRMQALDAPAYLKQECSAKEAIRLQPESSKFDQTYMIPEAIPVNE